MDGRAVMAPMGAMAVALSSTGIRNCINQKTCQQDTFGMSIMVSLAD